MRLANKAYNKEAISFHCEIPNLNLIQFTTALYQSNKKRQTVHENFSFSYYKQSCTIYFVFILYTAVPWADTLCWQIHVGCKTRFFLDSIPAFVFHTTYYLKIGPMSINLSFTQCPICVVFSLAHFKRLYNGVHCLVYFSYLQNMIWSETLQRCPEIEAEYCKTSFTLI